MEKFSQINKIKEIYTNGGNIIEYLKKNNNQTHNTIEDILISYEFQSGTYIKDLSHNHNFKKNYCYSLAVIIENLRHFNSIIEVGVGEATTLSYLIKQLKNKKLNIFGFDISWSRLKFAKKLLNYFNIKNVNLFVADLFNIPLNDDSVDIVYTNHSIEPNGGKEEEALKELYRICKKYLILLEPAYEFANKEAQERMIELGYITKLYDTAKKLNYNMIEHKPFDYSANPLNPTGLIIIEKKASEDNQHKLICPVTKTDLIKYNDSFLYSQESYLAYPILEGIPNLLKENAILATHLLTNFDDFLKKNNIALDRNFN